MGSEEKNMAYEDASETVAQLLNDGDRWDTSIVAKPEQIKAIYLWPKMPNPGIGCYEPELSVVDKSSYGAGKREDRDDFVTIDIRTLDRENCKLYEKAVRQIIQEFSTTIGTITLTSDFDNVYKHIWEDNRQDLSDRRFADGNRITIKIRLQRFGVIIATLP